MVSLIAGTTDNGCIRSNGGRTMKIKDLIGLTFLKLGTKIIHSDRVIFKVSNEQYEIMKSDWWDEFKYKLP